MTGTRRPASAPTPPRSSSGSARGAPCPSSSAAPGSTSALAAREGRPALWERLNRSAPAVAARLHPNDEVRVIRALEIVRAGGGAFSEAGRWRHPSGPYDVTYFGLTLDRAALAQRLRRRAQAFVAAGL